ncbi:MAG: hypothetical protein HPY66_0801 [Firmicutes bacterium]|nr:hypothetical protein [Bacillota bacterium]
MTIEYGIIYKGLHVFGGWLPFLLIGQDIIQECDIGKT